MRRRIIITTTTTTTNTPSNGATTTNDDEEYSPRLYAKSQEDLLRAQSYNPAPTTVPPPIAALAGNIGERHVLVFIGLPLRGKRTIALRLKRYLRFFHGARCRAFDVASSSSAASGRSISSQLREFLTDGGATTTTEHATKDEDGSVRRRHTDRLREEYGIDTFSDANAKHVDSGRVAVVYSSDASKTFYETWSGTSKERRRAILKDLAAIEAEERDFGGGSRKVKTIFIETTLTREELIEEVLAQRVARDVRNGKVSEEEIEEAKEKDEFFTVGDDGCLDFGPPSYEDVVDPEFDRGFNMAYDKAIGDIMNYLEDGKNYILIDNIRNYLQGLRDSDGFLSMTSIESMTAI